MRLSTASRLGRVANLPTIATNVIAAIALAGAWPSAATTVLACLAMAMMYLGGMFLRDAFDRDLDRVDHPERPIPAGEVGAAIVFDAGFALLAGGIAMIAVVALATGAGGKPVVSAVALGALIIFYDASDKRGPWAPLLTAMCRAGVYTTAALIVRPDLCSAVLIGATLMVAYLIGSVARPMSWPIAGLAVPFAFARPHGVTALVIYAGYLLWVTRALFVLSGRRSREALIAGIALLDALFLANLGRCELALVALAAFGATTILQRVAPSN